MEPQSQTPTLLSESKDVNSDQNFLTIGIFALCGMVSMYMSTRAFRDFLITAQGSSFLEAIGYGSIVLVVFCMCAMFVKRHTLLRMLVIGFSSVPCVIFFQYIFSDISWTLLGGVVVSTFFFYLGMRRGAHIVENSIHVRFREMAKGVLSKTLTGMLILWSVLFYVHYTELGMFTDTLGEGLTRETLRAIDPIINTQFPGVSLLNSTVGDVFRAVAEVQVLRAEQEMKKINPPTKHDITISDEMRAPVLQKTTIEIQRIAENVLGPLNTQDTFVKVMYRALKRFVESLSPSVQSFVGVGAAALFFFSLRGMSFFIMWILEVFAFFVFKILIITGVAHRAFENRNREFVVLS